MPFLINPLFLISFWQQKQMERHAASRTEVIEWDMHESPSVNILLMTKLFSLNPLSWGMDCLLTLWPLLIPCSLGNCCCTFGFLICIIVERNSLYNSLYILTDRSLKHPCSTTGLGLHVFLSLSLSPPPSLRLILWNVETHRAHSPAWAFKTSLRGRSVPSWAMQALF